MKTLVLIAATWVAISFVAGLLVCLAPFLPAVPEEDEREP